MSDELPPIDPTDQTINDLVSLSHELRLQMQKLTKQMDDAVLLARYRHDKFMTMGDRFRLEELGFIDPDQTTKER